MSNLVEFVSRVVNKSQLECKIIRRTLKAPNYYEENDPLLKFAKCFCKKTIVLKSP